MHEWSKEETMKEIMKESIDDVAIFIKDMIKRHDKGRGKRGGLSPVGSLATSYINNAIRGDHNLGHEAIRVIEDRNSKNVLAKIRYEIVTAVIDFRLAERSAMFRVENFITDDRFQELERLLILSTGKIFQQLED